MPDVVNTIADWLVSNPIADVSGQMAEVRRKWPRASQAEIIWAVNAAIRRQEQLAAQAKAEAKALSAVRHSRRGANDNGGAA